MPDVKIKDAAFGTSEGAGVTKRGQLVVAPLEFSDTYFSSFQIANTAYNLVTPLTNKRFVIDGIIFSSNKNVSSTNGAVISIYESDGPNSRTVSKQLFLLDVGRLDKGSIPDMNILTSQGVWINGETDDATTNVTLLGYYIEA
jgi:hypothetical protein